MTKAETQLAAMVETMRRVGIDPDAVTYTVRGSWYGLVQPAAETISADVRDAMIRELGQPTRPSYNKKLAEFPRTDARPFQILVDWPWPTCSECGQAVNAPVPA